MSATIHPGRLSLMDRQQTVESLLGPQIARNNFHHNKAKEHIPGSVVGMHLDGILQRIQGAIHHRIEQIDPSTPIESSSETPSWSEEKIRLQDFYAFLGEDAASESAFKLCEALCDQTDDDLLAVFMSHTGDMDELEIKQAALIRSAEESIGKVVFAADTDLETLAQVIELDKVNETMDMVDAIVDECFVAVLKQLEKDNSIANVYSPQEADLFMSIEKPKAIAKALLTSQGQLNIGLIGILKDCFFGHGKDLLEYEQGIILVLDQFDASWQKLVEHVQLPARATGPSNAMIRADLKLTPNEGLTKLHCQQEALGALLSHLIQGPVGDCFAVSWAIKKHDKFLKNAFEDYIELIQNGYLTRVVDGKKEHFFYEKTIADASKSALITLNADGVVAEYKAPFWECPNLIAACRQMGIGKIEVCKVAILQALKRIQPLSALTTWNDVIKACAKVAAGDTDRLLMRGKYAFSLSNNRLLRAWETALAGIAEARPGDYVRGKVNNCVMSVFQKVFSSQERWASHYKKTLIEEAKAVFQRTLNDSFREVYNRDIPLGNGSSSSGGFELYQRDVSDLTQKGIQIATPEQFQSFVFQVIDRASSAAQTNVTLPEDKALLTSVFQALHLSAAGTDFMKNVLYAYDDANKKIRDPVANYQSLERTPMTALVGDNPWEVMVVDTANDFSPHIQTIRAKDPNALLTWLLNLAKWKESTKDVATSPEPAFDIEFEGPEFKNFLEGNDSPGGWIKKTLITPGLLISKAAMDPGAKLIFEGNVKNWLTGQMSSTIPDSLVQDMDTLFHAFNSKEMTVQQFAQRAQDGIVKIFKLNEAQTRSLSLALDSMLIEALPAAQKKSLEQQAVRFANTNWSSGDKDIYFCCFLNPRTALVDFGSINKDKTGLRRMDQYEWIDNQKWSVNPVKM